MVGEADHQSNIINKLAARHQSIFDQIRAIKPEELKTRNELNELIAFNGYYCLDPSIGAFFTVDANMYFSVGLQEPYYTADLIICLDGKKPFSIEFTGSFDGSRLMQQNEAIFIDLSFFRTDGSDGTTARCTGSIGVEYLAPVKVSGCTYNNPIPNSLFMGTYYLMPPPETSSGNTAQVVTKVLEIGDKNAVLYDFGSGDGVLKPVDSYIYNLNMYYFSFDSKEDSLIMGTSATTGLACNNITRGSGYVTSRPLQTILKTNTGKREDPNLASSALALYSGYYPLPFISPLAFFSVQAEYAILDSIPVYSVLISLSLDGISANGWYFNQEGMSFIDNRLVMIDQGIELKFERTYNAGQRSLVTVTGTVGTYKGITTYTLFNPVPLSAFKGAVMTNDTGETLAIVNDMKVIYNTIEMTGFVYVPLMYVLANPWQNTTKVFSLGFSALNGTACIVLDVPTNKTSFVWGIPKP
jgi:hypothetical protein